MTALLGKFAPCAIVLAAVSYCCWPYLDDASRRPGAGDEKKLPEIAAQVLSPKVQPAPGRDPFGLITPVDMFKVVDTKAGKKEGQQPTAGTGSKGTSTAGGNTGTTQTAAKETDPEVLKKATENDLKAAKNNLTLNATLVRGNRRVAMINGERFTEGDTVERANGNVRLIKISKILPKAVILEKNGQTIELGYPDIFAKTGSAQIKSGPATSPRATTPARPATRQTTQSTGTRPTGAPKAKPRSAARSMMTR